MKFETWLIRVNRLVEAKIGMTLDCLPEVRTRDGFDNGETPAEFCHGTVGEMLEETFGENPWEEE